MFTLIGMAVTAIIGLYVGVIVLVCFVCGFYHLFIKK